jgi:hypothetical protein
MTDGWTELDLPRPPSVNRFMRKLGNKTPCVQAWTWTVTGAASAHVARHSTQPRRPARG